MNIKADTTDVMERLKHSIVEDLRLFEDQDRIDFLNELKSFLHEISPLAAQPVDLVEWVDVDKVEANNYNPNSVASKEMELTIPNTPCLLYTSPSPRDRTRSRMPSSA